MSTKPVCHLDENCEVICVTVPNPTPPLPVTRGVFDAAVLPLFPYLTPGKLALLYDIFAHVSMATLPDAAIPFRTTQILGAIDELLADRQPSSMLFFHYSKLPAAVLGAFYLNRGDVGRMQEVFVEFSTLDPWQ